MRSWAQAAFEPRAVAVVGASPTPGKLGNVVLSNLLDGGFEGTVVPVHPTAEEVLGRPAVPRLSEADRTIDLALIATPPSAAEAVLRDVARSSARVVVLLGGGYAESGPGGARLERRLGQLARSAGLRLIGPNCFGLVSVHHRLNASMALGLPRLGGVSLFTQSGAYGMAAFMRSNESATGFSRVLSAGNKADIDEVDALRAFDADPHTRVIALVLESITRGRELVEAAHIASATKPIVALKLGASVAGRRAALSHTAALASNHRLARAALRQAGVRLVDDGHTLLDVAAALDAQGPWPGERVGIVTNSGGTGVELADLLEAEGLVVPRFSDALASQLDELLPPHAAARNPVDVTTDWGRFPALYGGSIRALVESDEVDAIVVVLLQRSALDSAVAERVIDEAQRASKLVEPKPVHVCWVAPREADANRLRLQEAGIPCHAGPAQTARVLELTRRVPGVPPRAPSSAPPVGVRASSDPPHADARGSRWRRLATTLELLESNGLPCAPWRLANSADEAIEAVEAIGFPVALKADRPGLVHKSDAGGIALDLANDAAVRDAFAALEQRLGPGPAVVQAMVPAGLELMVGSVRDDQFGPMLAVGLGGVFVELLDDLAWRQAPIDAREASTMLAELRAAAALDGARGGPVVDRDALCELIAAISRLVARTPSCHEIDLNPIIANPDGLWIVDARLRSAAPGAVTSSPVDQTTLEGQ